MNELIISGNTISLVEKKIIHTTTIDEFKQSLIDSAPMNTAILPIGCKAMASTPKNGSYVYVIERQPGITSFSFHKEKGRAETVAEYAISLPFIQFYVKLRACPMGYAFSGLYLSCTKKPIMDMKDDIFVLPIPNVFSGGERKVCTGAIEVSMGNPARICEELIATFFAAPSNLDLSMDYPLALCKTGKGHEECLKEWQRLSEDNPLFGISADGIKDKSFSLHKSTFETRMKCVMEMD